jgi:hypothetical protein
MRQKQMVDTDVYVEGRDSAAQETAKEAEQRTRRPLGRTLSGSQTTFTKGDPNKYTVANNRIAGESAVTVLFGIPTAATFLSPQNHSPTPRAYAEIRWLVDGVGVRRLISVGSGEQVTGVGEYVSVQIWDDTTPDDADPNPTYDIVCVVAPGTRGSTATPPTYFPKPNTFILASSASANILIPPNVGIKTLSVVTDDPANVQIEFLDYAGNIIFETTAADVGTDHFEIPRGGLEVVLTNTNMAAANNTSIAFGVSG